MLKLLIRLKRFAVFFVALAVMLTSIGFVLPAAKAETGVLTVSQAIANNTGTGTVEGYIVGFTIGTNNYDFEAPFQSETNFAIADAPGERSAAKIMPVQLPANLRPQFGLISNPAGLGKKVRITGTLAAYFTVPGLRSPTAMEFVQTTPDPDPVLVSVAEARSKLGQKVILQGVVTADNAAIGGGRLSTYLQDATGGINLFAFDPAGYPALIEGDRIQVTGTIKDYRGLAEIEPASDGIVVLEKGAALPEAVSATLADLADHAKAEALEGRLVKLSGYVQSVPSSPAGGGYNVAVIDDQFRSTTLRVMEGSLDITQVQSGTWYEMTAIVSQYNSYQLIPRKASDLVALNPQPKAPSAAGEYSSVIASVVDGDTVHLTTPVLGSTKVRFLNIDTPETYHKVVTEADANQKQHGEAAKAFMNTLLKAGDEVVVKIGEEATDAYGRLLAQVIRKADGMNVNLEMVEKGYASTYFIWPIGSDYEMYSQAVKRAVDGKLGIWNPENPLMELPFVFRAREQGKGLLRYVGNYYTKKIVEPADWAKVPVEARVFFASAEEAAVNGYVPGGDEPAGNIAIQLLGVNDWHGKIDITSTAADRPGVQFGRADYLAAYLRQEEATNPNTLIMHSGDMIGGSSPVSALLQDEPTVEIMESIGFDVGTVGNHELDEGVTELLRMINGGEHPNGTKGYDGMNFPVVAANIEYKATGQLVFQPYAVKEIGGAKIGFIGVATTATPSMVMPTGISNIRFTDEAEAVNRFVPELQAQGVEAIVILAHVPGEQDGTTAKGEIAALASRVNDAVDVIFAAHNHVKVNAVVDNKLIVQAWEYGNAFVDVDLEIDPVTRDIVKKSARIVDVVQSAVAPDPSVAAILAKYELEVAPKVNAVVGSNASEMLKGYPTKELAGDMALGNFIADGMKFAMKSDVALMNGGGVRDNLNAGPITWGELFNIQPFGNTLVKVEVTGKQLEEILNAMINPKYGPDSFIGGATYTWSTQTNKLTGLYLSGGTPVNPEATYSLTVNNYMYFQTSAKYKLIAEYGRNFEQGMEDIAASVEFAKSFAGPIDYAAEARISTDITAPVTESVVQENVVTWTAADAGVGVAYTEFRINQGEWQRGASAELIEDGSHVVEFRSVDKVWNREPVKSITILLDRIAPVIQAPESLKLYHYEELPVSISAVDAGSGLQGLAVSLNGKPVEPSFTLSGQELGLGLHTLVVSATDKAGNTASLTVPVEVRIDLDHLDELLLAGVNSGKLDSGISKGLEAKVQAAQAADQVKTRNNVLNALANQIRAQAGKKIDAAFAELLLQDLAIITK